MKTESITTSRMSDESITLILISIPWGLYLFAIVFNWYYELIDSSYLILALLSFCGLVVMLFYSLPSLLNACKKLNKYTRDIESAELIPTLISYFLSLGKKKRTNLCIADVEKVGHSNVSIGNYDSDTPCSLELDEPSVSPEFIDMLTTLKADLFLAPQLFLVKQEIIKKYSRVHGYKHLAYRMFGYLLVNKYITCGSIKPNKQTRRAAYQKFTSNFTALGEDAYFRDYKYDKDSRKNEDAHWAMIKEIDDFFIRIGLSKKTIS